MIYMATIGYMDSTSSDGSPGCSGSRRRDETDGVRDGAAPAPLAGLPREEGDVDMPRRMATTASCKMCQHMDVCKAYEEALMVNTRFAAMRFIKFDTPIIVADRLAERCAKYTPPDRAEIAEAIKHELR